MSRRRAHVAAALASAALAAAPAGVALADDDDDKPKRDTVATAEVTQDGGRAFAFEWSLQRQVGGRVDQLNSARALARCTNCRATALAFQIVLASGRPAPVTPRNQAIAVNDQCTQCVVYAGARQFVRVTDRPVKFTAAGRRTLAEVRGVLRGLERQDLDAAAQQAEVERQEARVLDALATQLVATKGSRKPKRVGDDDNRADDR